MSRRAPLLLAIAVALFPAHGARAHEARPAYLQLSALGGGSWDVLFKVPATSGLRLDLHVRLPAGCGAGDRVERSVGSAHVERWRARCPEGLAGQRVGIDGLAATRTDVLARVQHADGSAQTRRLTPDHTSFRVSRAPDGLSVARSYLGLGVEHILGGIDHLLFVLALVFLVRNARRLLGAVTAFTAAHSLTLAAATLGWLHVPSPPVEASIALSIVCVAAELVRGEGVAERRPWIVAFCFGLLHGLGFAGALRQVGLPDQAIPVALAFFNVGVEIGQLTFIGAVFALLVSAARLRRGASAPTVFALAGRLARPAAYAIGIPASYWLIERTLAFWA